MDVELYHSIVLDLIYSKNFKFYIKFYNDYLVNVVTKRLPTDGLAKLLEKLKIRLLFLLREKTNKQEFNKLWKKYVKNYFYIMLYYTFCSFLGGLYENFGVSGYKKLEIPAFSKFKETYQFISHPFSKELLDNLENDFRKLKKLYDDAIDELKNHLHQMNKNKKKYILNVLPHEHSDSLIKKTLLYTDDEE